MLAQQCLLLLALLYAPRTLAVKPFSLRIYTPDGDDYFIKTLNEKWKIDSHDQAHFKDLLKHAKKGIPNHKETKYSVSGQIDWTEELSEQTPVQRRAFWVGRGDPNVVRERDLLKVSDLNSWMTHVDAASVYGITSRLAEKRHLALPRPRMVVHR